MAEARTRRNPYATLGVARDADLATIKKAYRKLAQQHHPDLNKDDPRAEESFKQVSAAYATLSDPERRRAFDEFGDVSLDPNFDAERARRAQRGFGGGFRPRGSGGVHFEDHGGFGDVFEQFFGGADSGPQRRTRRRVGADLETTIELGFHEAALGGEHRISVARPTAQGMRNETLSIRIPPGVADRARIRLSGKGAEGASGGPPGDLYATVRVRPHPFFRRKGRNLQIDLPVSVSEAVLGAEVEVPTLESRVTLRVPAGTDGGTRLRLRGKGIPGASSGDPAGDLYVVVRIRVPRSLDPEMQRRFEELESPEAAAERRKLFDVDS